MVIKNIIPQNGFFSELQCWFIFLHLIILSSSRTASIPSSSQATKLQTNNIYYSLSLVL